jgi:protein-S-isoprenylcysteine O-methyltransferase Ste14
LRRPPFYLLAGAVYLGLCRLLWRPLRITLSLPARLLALLIGGSLYYSGLALTLWGRFALGKMYDVSSTFGAHLYADHRLVTDGPFAFVRHPMYLGILLTGLGGLLLYRSWTFVFLLTHIPSLVIRARREEEVLAEEFGREWQAYCERTPAWIPHLRQRRPLARLPLAH